MNYVSLFKNCPKRNALFAALTNDAGYAAAVRIMDQNRIRPAIKNAWEKDKAKFGLLAYDHLCTMGVIKNDHGSFAQAATILDKKK